MLQPPQRLAAGRSAVLSLHALRCKSLNGDACQAIETWPDSIVERGRRRWNEAAPESDTLYATLPKSSQSAPSFPSPRRSVAATKACKEYFGGAWQLRRAPTGMASLEWSETRVTHSRATDELAT